MIRFVITNIIFVFVSELSGSVSLLLFLAISLSKTLPTGWPLLVLFELNHFLPFSLFNWNYPVFHCVYFGYIKNTTFIMSINIITISITCNFTCNYSIVNTINILIILISTCAVVVKFYLFSTLLFRFCCDFPHFYCADTQWH